MGPRQAVAAVVNPTKVNRIQDLPKYRYESLRIGNSILLPKLFWPTVRKNCSSDREKLLKFEAEGQEFAKILGSLE